MDVNLSTIKDRFPEWSSLIERLYQKNASFHSLCDNYLLHVGQIRRYTCADQPISSTDRSELRMLMSELEVEINIYLYKFNEDETQIYLLLLTLARKKIDYGISIVGR